jgi:Glycosyltransferase
MKKRVLFIASQPFFEWRGSPIRLGFDVTALRDNGYEVDFLTLPIGERREIENVRILRAPNIFRAKKISIGPSPLKLAFDAVIFLQALALITRHKYAVIHGIEDCGLLALILGKLRGAKTVFEKHSDTGSYKKGLLVRAYATVERHVIRHADAIIGTGPGLVEQVKKIKPAASAHHISDIPSSLTEPDPAGTARARAELQKTPDETLALYVGSFATYQGIDLLFNAIPPALAKAPTLRFIIIGGSDAEIAHWRAWLTERGCEEKVSFIGKRAPDILPSYLAAADILLSPRIAGVNTPLKLLDYLKVSRGIVATDHPANRLILDESTAILTPPDPASFADGIIRLTTDHATRASLSANCRRLIDEKYNFNVFRDDLKNAYEQLFCQNNKQQFSGSD